MQNTDFKPEFVEIALQQHIGAPALPTVQIGDNVKEGQLIGQIPEGGLGATVHASFNGTITKITKDSIVIKVGV